MNKKFKDNNTLDRSSVTCDLAFGYVSNSSNPLEDSVTKVITEYHNKIILRSYNISNDGKFYIKDTELLEVGGHICGSRPIGAYIRVYNIDGTTFKDSKTTQSNPGGNLYFAMTLSPEFIKLDKTKEYYTTLNVYGYNTNAADLNAGYGASSFMYCRKIK